MNIPLHSKKTINLPMAKTILEEYLNARRTGLSVLHSKRWAIYAGESIRFGRNVPHTYYKGNYVAYLKSTRLKKSAWYLGTSKHAQESTFDRLMKTRLGTARFSGKPKNVDGWMLSALKRHDKKLYMDLKRAMRNYKNIVGISPPMNTRFLSIYRQWLKIHRGRNLFVKGFGKFEISAAMKRLESEFGTVDVVGHILSPTEITAAGYEISRWYFEQLIRRPIVRRYYLKYRSFWSVNKNRLDEIFTDPAVQKIMESPEIAPETLLRELELLREQWRLSAHSQGDTSPFAHLTEAPAVETPFGVLRPVKSPQEAIQVGSAMRNCASNYIGAIRAKSTLLLALFNESGEPIALGEVVYDQRAHRWVWGQRLGPGNENLEKSVYEVFQTYPLIKSGVWEHVEQDLLED